MTEKVRIDKWLWGVRIFKSRSIATDACKTGKVSIEGKSVKPSYLVGRGEVIHVKKDGFNYQFRVIDLVSKRVSATLAQPCYENCTPEEELNKYNAWYIGKAKPEMRERGAGRPTKKERREIDRYKNEHWAVDFPEAASDESPLENG